MTETRDLPDPDAGRIVNDVCAAILKGAGDAMKPYEDRPNSGAYLVAAFSMAADLIAREADPIFGRTLYEMLQRRYGQDPAAGEGPEAEPETPSGPRV